MRAARRPTAPSALATLVEPPTIDTTSPPGRSGRPIQEPFSRIVIGSTKSSAVASGGGVAPFQVRPRRIQIVRSPAA
jgi:hypothetical protein